MWLDNAVVAAGRDEFQAAGVCVVSTRTAPLLTAIDIAPVTQAVGLPLYATVSPAVANQLSRFFRFAARTQVRNGRRSRRIRHVVDRRPTDVGMDHQRRVLEQLVLQLFCRVQRTHSNALRGAIMQTASLKHFDSYHPIFKSKSTLYIEI